MLQDSAIELLTAVLDDGSHVRGAIDARLRRSPDFRAGLSTPVSLPGRLSNRESLSDLLDLLAATGLVVVDHRGEYAVNTDAPHMHDSSSRPLLALLSGGSGESAVRGGFGA